MIRSLIAVNIIPPLAACLMIAFLPLAPIVKAGIVLMAIAPVSPLVHLKVIEAGGSKEYARGVYVEIALLSVIVVPAVFYLASRAFGRSDPIIIPAMTRTVVANVLIPLAIGMTLRWLAPAFSERAGPFIYGVSLLFLTLAFLPILGSLWPEIMRLIEKGALLSMTAVVIIALASGHLLGGPERLDRATLAIASSSRHPGVAVMIADSAFVNVSVEAAVLLFMFVGLAACILYKIWMQERPSPSPPAR